ncbi:unnamed protein product [Bathycoccus prasinos]
MSGYYPPPPPPRGQQPQGQPQQHYEQQQRHNYNNGFTNDANTNMPPSFPAGGGYGGAQQQHQQQPPPPMMMMQQKQQQQQQPQNMQRYGQPGGGMMMPPPPLATTGGGGGEGPRYQQPPNAPGLPPPPSFSASSVPSPPTAAMSRMSMAPPSTSSAYPSPPPPMRQQQPQQPQQQQHQYQHQQQYHHPGPPPPTGSSSSVYPTSAPQMGMYGGGAPPPGAGMMPGMGGQQGGYPPDADARSIDVQNLDQKALPRPGEDEARPNSNLSCDPKYLRLTVGALPQSVGLKQRFALPVGCIVRPMCPGDSVPTAQFGSSGIVRCRRCRTYINPFVQFIEGGRRYRCNVCSLPNDVPVDYFCALDENGVRRDVAERPELRSGTVEFLASAEYMVRPPMPPAYFFAFDVSQTAVRSGFLKSAIDTVRDCLDSMQSKSDRTRIGFITYDRSIHFYGLRSTSMAPSMMVVGELNDPFAPMPDDLLVNLQECRTVVDATLDVIATSFLETDIQESAMGPALQAAYSAVSQIGGKLMIFQSTLPSIGAGRLLSRDDARGYEANSKEHELRNPADNFYKSMAAECSRQQVCVDVFCTSVPYADIASMCVLPKYTGGDVRYYPQFSLAKDEVKFKTELTRNLTRDVAWESVCRVRCSKGFRVCAFNGHFFIRSLDLLALPATNADQTHAVYLAHDEVVPNMQACYIQCALLYTSADGERRIRVHTMQVPVVNDMTDLFRAIDSGAMACFLTRLSAERTNSARLQDARDALTHKLVDALKEYKLLGGARHNFGFNSLAFPESMKLLPLFAMCATKTLALKGAPRDVAVDNRVECSFDIMSCSAEDCLRMMYPACYALHGGSEDAGIPENDSIEALMKMKMPPRTALAGERIDARGIYLIDDGRKLLVWVGGQCEQKMITSIFGDQGCPDPFVDAYLPTIRGNKVNEKVRNTVKRIRSRNQARYQALTVIRQGTPQEALLFNHLVEDRASGGGMGYGDFLAQLHRLVQQAANAGR